jgi:hypothetical protein
MPHCFAHKVRDFDIRLPMVFAIFPTLSTNSVFQIANQGHRLCRRSHDSDKSRQVDMISVNFPRQSGRTFTIQSNECDRTSVSDIASAIQIVYTRQGILPFATLVFLSCSDQDHMSSSVLANHFY